MAEKNKKEKLQDRIRYKIHTWCDVVELAILV